MHDVILGLALVVALFCTFLLCIESGFRFGHAGGRAQRSVPSTIENGVFALLALLLAFAFGGGIDRLNARRELVLREANAIETAYRRVDLLPAREQPAMRAIFARYLDARLAAYDNVADRPATAAKFAAAERIQDEIWTVAVRASRDPSRQSVPILVLPALNEMFDVTTNRAIALYVQTPPFIMAVLVGVALLACALAGYSMAAQPARSGVHSFAFAAILALTVYGVVDLDYARYGAIRVNAADQVLTRLRDSIH